MATTDRSERSYEQLVELRAKEIYQEYYSSPDPTGPDDLCGSVMAIIEMIAKADRSVARQMAELLKPGSPLAINSLMMGLVLSAREPRIAGLLLEALTSSKQMVVASDATLAVISKVYEMAQEAGKL